MIWGIRNKPHRMPKQTVPTGTAACNSKRFCMTYKYSPYTGNTAPYITNITLSAILVKECESKLLRNADRIRQISCTNISDVSTI